MNFLNISEKHSSKIIFVIVVLAFLLSIYGLYWGLPNLWQPDEASWNVSPAISVLRTRDFNPHFFMYPSFHLYLLSIVFLPFVLFLKLTGGIRNVEPFIKDYPAFITTIYILARLLSVFLATATVYLIYVISKKTYKNALVGIYSAAFLAVTMAFINVAHFGTGEITLIFLIVLSILIALKIVEDKKNSLYYYMLLGFVAGLAVSTKYNAVFIVIPIALAYILDVSNSVEFKLKFMHKYVFNKKIFILAFFMIFGFLIGTPYCVFDFYTFLQDILFQFFARSDYKGFHDMRPGYIMVAMFLNNAMGTPLFILSIFGFIYGIIDAVLTKNKSFWIIFSFILIYVLALCLNKISTLHYLVPLLCFLNILNGRLVYKFLNSKYKVKIIYPAVILIVFAYSFLFTLCADYKFKYDSRYAAADWIKKNISSSKTIEVYDRPLGYLPEIPAEYSKVSSIPVIYNTQSEINLKDMKKLKNIMSMFKTKASGGYYKGNVSEEKQITYKQAVDTYYNSIVLNKRNPDYIILSSGFYHRFLNNPKAYPEMTEYFNNLINEKENFKIVSRFETKCVLNAVPEFANPTIIILKRKDD